MSEQELQARIDAARAKREEIESRLAARRKAQALADEVEREERAAKDAETLEALESEHGLVGKELCVVQTDEGMIVVKRAHANIVNRFLEKGTMKLEEVERLVRPSVVHPDKAVYDRICERMPLVRTQCANGLVQLAGLKREEDSKK